MDDATAQALFAAAPPAVQNSPYVQPGAQPTLTPPGVNEPGFQQWVQQNKVPFDPSANADYDMRGFYNALQSGNPRATTAVNPNDQQLHYPDYWKMPSHQSFSAESKWAAPVAPQWNAQDQLISPGGRILYDEKAQAMRKALNGKS